LKNKSQYSHQLTPMPTKKTSRIPAKSIMEATSGMTAIKTLKMLRAMGNITRQATVKAKMRTMVVQENKAAPKAVAVNLEHLLVAAAVAKQEAHPIGKVTNTIASMRRRVNKRIKSKLQVRKF